MLFFVKTDKDSDCLKETPNFKIEQVAASSYATWEQIKLPQAVKKHSLDFLHSTCNTSALSLSVPLILTVHDIIYLEKADFKGTAYQNFGNLYRRFVVPGVVKKSKVVITVSNYEKEVIKKRLSVPEEKIKVIYNAVNRKFNNNYPVDKVTDFKKKYNLPDEFILFLGNTSPKKNTHNVILAYIAYCKAVNTPTPLVVLDYNKNLVEDMLTKTGDTDLINNFIFPGFIASDAMPLMYNTATLFLYPSLRESFGLPILEAMGCNTPVITSNTSCMPEIAADAALLIDPFSVQEITDGIKLLLSDKKMREELSSKGLARAAEFSWKAAAEKLLDIYNQFE